MKSINQLIRPELRAFKPYKPSPTLEELADEAGIPVDQFLKLNSGENLFTRQLYWLYPDPEAKQLRQELSKYTGLPVSYIIAGNGSDELIDLIIRLFVSTKDEVINLPPTFSMYSFYGQLNGAKVVNIPRTKNFAINAEKIIKATSAKTKLIFICNPNNPTGSLTPKKQILEILKKTTAIVVVDEAYFEYCNQTAAPYVKKYSNLIVLRSFSKWAGLAGLRLGYALANPKIIQKLYSVKSPYNVNSVAQQAGVITLKDKVRLLAKLKDVLKGRQFLTNQLSKLADVRVYPTRGAYVLFRLQSRSAVKLRDYLRENGIEVKVIDKTPLTNCIRVNITPIKVARKLLDLIAQFLQSKNFNDVDAVIFDMDGVLVDVSKSYRKTIQKTVNILLKREGVKRKASQRQIEVIKSIPGFNNDWDVTFILFKAIRGKEKVSSLKPPTRDKRRTKLYQKAKLLFQNIYLGSSLFQKIEKRQPPVPLETGFINNEVPLIKKSTLIRLKDSGLKLGIATGRPRKEALWAIKAANLETLFPSQFIVALEDTSKEKPNPEPLLEAKVRIKSKTPVYIGDSISDAQAAKAANMPCIFVGKEKLGVTQIKSVNQVTEVII